jgi:soluble cytochrome b562
MKVLMYVVAILAALWLFSSIATTKAQEAYRKGYRDGFNALAVDNQCAAWLMNSNIKEAKSRICGK